MAKKKKKVDDFKHGNVKGCRLDPKHSLPEASKFTEPDQNKQVKQGGQLF